MRLIDADDLKQRLNPDDWGTQDEEWRPEREFGELIDHAPTIDIEGEKNMAYQAGFEEGYAAGLSAGAGGIV